MTASPTCPRCNAPLFRGDQGSALLGLCPLCLLQDASQREGDAARGQEADLGEVREQFSELEILGPLGRGGMGVVYRARQPRLDRLVALKVLAPECASDPAFAQRFLREARAMAKLNHPNIVQVFDFGEQNGRFFLLMELVEGLSLRQLMQDGELEPAQALTIVPAICQGLQYAHECGVVHRDIKPENILIDKRGVVKILDFGLAKLVQSPRKDGSMQTRASQIMGTPHYMAPEQINSPLSVDHRADIYSVGVVFYELLTGELPVGAFDPPSLHSGVDARLDSVVQRALEREPDRRYQAAEEVRTDVEDIAHSSPQQRQRPTLPQQNAEDEDLWDKRATPGFVGSLALAAAWFWIAILAWQYASALRETQPRSMEIRNIWICLAVAYPLAHLGAAAGRALINQTSGIVLTAIAVVMQILALLVTGSGGPWVGVLDMCLEIVAALGLFIGHRFLERWVRRGNISAAILFVFLLIGAAIAHSAWSEFAPGRDAFYYTSGMTALLGISSAIALLPLARALEAKGQLHKPLLRAFGVAVIAACFYFNQHIF